MALHNILAVATSYEATTRKTLEAALILAERHKAHLTVIYTVPPLDIPVYFNAPPPQSLIETQSKINAEALDQARKIFDDLVEEYQWKNRSSWHSYEGNPDEITALNARYADIVIINQQNEEDFKFPYAPKVQEIILQSGRPVLVIPREGDLPQAIGERILVAWDSTREAARAVNDAMLLLENADFVSVSVIDANDKPEMCSEDSAIELTTHLARHDISAQANYEVVEKESVGEALLRKVESTEADMMVMGAYGTPLLRRIVMGSTTQHIMDNMTVPVLFSH